MTAQAPDTLVFTDMDGTLLDHHTYDIEPARPMLAYLKEHAIPVIPTTSKTFAEMVSLRQRYGLDGPFIVENGAAVYIPHGVLPQKPLGAVWADGYWCKSLSSPRHHWLKIIQGVKADFEGCFVGFSAMSVEDICAATGLSKQDAELAAQRQYGEPILFTGSDDEKVAFIDAITRRGASTLEGGRFLHVCGVCNKGNALAWLTDTYTQQFGLSNRPKTIALGDSGNDIAMLKVADIAVRILSPTRTPPEFTKQKGQTLTSTLFGPSGWNEMLSHYFKNKS